MWYVYSQEEKQQACCYKESNNPVFPILLNRYIYEIPSISSTTLLFFSFFFLAIHSSTTYLHIGTQIPFPCTVTNQLQSRTTKVPNYLQGAQKLRPFQSSRAALRRDDDAAGDGEGEASSVPTGTSESGASTRLTLMERMGRKLRDLSRPSLEKTSEELRRMR